jgi:hypothetical protein
MSRRQPLVQRLGCTDRKTARREVRAARGQNRRDQVPRVGSVLIIAGSLTLDPADRAAFLAANADAVRQARQATGCLDFVQAADPLDPSRINIFERWDTEDDLLAFRGAGQPATDSPPIQSADVMRYVISSVEEP